MANGPALAAELHGVSLENLLECVLPFRSSQSRSELLEKLREEGLSAPSDLLRVSQQALETKLASHAAFNFVQLADVVSLRQSAEEGVTAEQGGRRGDRERSRSNGRGGQARRRDGDGRDGRRRRQDGGKRGGKGARGDREERPKQAKPELWGAVEEGDEALVRMCLQRGDEVEEKYLGWSPLMKAAEEDQMDIMEILLSKRADLEVANRKGRTALSFAAAPSMKRKTAVSALRLLLQHGADTSRKDDNGLTPKEKAEKEERQDALLLFEEFERSGRADAASDSEH